MNKSEIRGHEGEEQKMPKRFLPNHPIMRNINKPIAILDSNLNLQDASISKILTRRQSSMEDRNQMAFFPHQKSPNKDSIEEMDQFTEEPKKKGNKINDE